MDVEPILIETSSELDRACQVWSRQPAIGVDTEFVRERTFYPGLGLIQIADDSSCWLVDPLAINDLEPLHAVLQDHTITKIFHSCGEDLEVLYHCLGDFPRPVFDTQVASAFAGWGWSLGYARMVQEMFDVELPKDKTRTNWLRRPLSAAQLTYAALDVAYLIPAWNRLRRELRSLSGDRESWASQELESLFDVERFLPPIESVYRRIGAHKSLAPRPLAALISLATWREKQARRRNLPRNFVLKEKALVDVARRQPTTQRALAAIDSLGPNDIRRHGRALIRLVRQARDLPPDQLPGQEPVVDLRPYRADVDRLRSQASRIAEELTLPPELVATRRTIEKLMRRAVTGQEPILPRELRGWRREPIGHRLLTSLQNSRS